MAYFTRTKMIQMALEMYNANKRFMYGGTDDRSGDLKVLIECQQKALVLGEYLETFGMDYSVIVSAIEEYCNHVYEIAENLANDEVVVEHYNRITGVLARIVQLIEDKIVEISSIDVYDFRGLVSTNKEKILVENEINRLIDQCLGQSGSIVETEEYYRPIMVGTY